MILRRPHLPHRPWRPLSLRVDWLDGGKSLRLGFVFLGETPLTKSGWLVEINPLNGNSPPKKNGVKFTCFFQATFKGTSLKIISNICCMFDPHPKWVSHLIYRKLRYPAEGLTLTELHSNTHQSQRSFNNTRDYLKMTPVFPPQRNFPHQQKGPGYIAAAGNLAHHHSPSLLL